MIIPSGKPGPVGGELHSFKACWQILLSCVIKKKTEVFGTRKSCHEGREELIAGSKRMTRKPKSEGSLESGFRGKKVEKGGFPILEDWAYNKRRSFDDNRKSKMV